MRRREKPEVEASREVVPEDIAAGPLVDVWADPDTQLGYRAGRVDAFDLMVNAWGHWRRARERWIAEQPDPRAARKMLPGRGPDRSQRSLDVKQ